MSTEIADRLRTEAEEIKNAGGKGYGIKQIASGRQDMFRLNPYLIAIEPGWNGRESDDPENIEHIDSLAKSIAEIGVKEPLTVYWKDDRPVVTDGHCRLLATFRAIEVYGAEVKSIPCKTEERYSTEADRVLSQLVRNKGKPLSPFEKGTVYKRLIDLGWTEKEIARKEGVTYERVCQILELRTKATPEIRLMVVAGKISSTFALQTIKKSEGDAKVAEKTLKKAVETAKAEGKTKATAKHVEETAGKKRETLKAIFDRADIDNEDEFSVVVTFTATDFEKIREILKL